MSDITIFNSIGASIDVINGVPPVDQTALVATLTAQVDQLTADLAAMTAARNAAEAKIEAVRAAIA